MWDGLPECTTDFGFSHQLVAPKDIMEIMFGPGSHVWPHEHMTYWGVAGEAGGVAGPQDHRRASGRSATERARAVRRDREPVVA